MEIGKIVLNFVGNNEINLIIMRIINCLKAAVLAVLVGSSLWSCSGDKGKTRYVPVVLDGEEKWSILDTKTGDVLCQNDFDEMPSVERRRDVCGAHEEWLL